MRFSALLLLAVSLLAACAPTPAVTSDSFLALPADLSQNSGFMAADGSRPLRFPADFGAHEDFRTEWWYYTGNLADETGREFGFELTLFRVGLLPPGVSLPADSAWYNHSVYFAHFALSDLQTGQFYAFERYSRPGPGLAGAQGDPYRVWLEDWQVLQTGAEAYRLSAAQEGLGLTLDLADEGWVILHGDAGYSRKGRETTNASYYYSQPRLRAQGKITINGAEYAVQGWVWKDHEFSTGVLDEGQIGWDWFSLQLEDGSALMLFQLREADRASAFSSGTWVDVDGRAQPLGADEFSITVTEEWQSPQSGGVYPAGWRVQIPGRDCAFQISPKMANQELHFPAVTYWEGAVRAEGQCGALPLQGSGYVELTGYAGNLPLP